VGTGQHLADCATRAAQERRARKLPVRPCLGKGCRRRFRPKRNNQRYCQDPDCLRRVRRWQAAKRQQHRRAQEEHRHAHAAAERKRRQQRKADAALRPKGATPNRKPEPAWSRRRRKSSDPFCNRPGCWAEPASVGGQRSSYCSKTCRQALERVLDRERKARQRKSFCGRYKRQMEYDRAGNGAPSTPHESTPGAPDAPGPPVPSNPALRSYPMDLPDRRLFNPPPVPKRGGWP
jgi:hypothetical protein